MAFVACVAWIFEFVGTENGCCSLCSNPDLAPIFFMILSGDGEGLSPVILLFSKMQMVDCEGLELTSQTLASMTSSNHWPLSASDLTLRRSSRCATERGTKIHMHEHHLAFKVY
ncbi:hypothetical protein IWZ03DRAFT_367750 [Phyllosticta citriasiana]|uniref:Uncharacterized protein n=1 Tax=Phyllosticta citriasiana TaxID=595635 RepID=A0ABR1L0Q1_9PEZI